MRNLKFPMRMLTVAVVFSGMLSQPMLAQDTRPAAQPGAATSAKSSRQTAGATRGDDLAALRDQVSAQQKQIEQLTQVLRQLQDRLDRAEQPVHSAARPTPQLGEVASTTPMVPAASSESVKEPVLPSRTAVAAVQPAATAAGKGQEGEEDKSPLQLKVGSAYITPVGFMDFTTMYRSSDGGSGIGTNFGGIPYGNVYQNNLSEARFSMQNSRVGFRVDGMVHGAHIIGYMESDFLGNNPGNVAVSSNSNTMRSRLYWVDARTNHFEVLGGQTWSLLTPGRTGISPLPGDIFYTQNMDVNYQAGLVWGRIPELRLVYHPSSKAAFAFAVDSPEQYVGGSAGGGLITFPSALATTYAGELNVGSNTLGVPNVSPDFIAKLALDPSKKFHFEIGGIERNFKVWNPTTSNTYTTAGGGGFLNLNFELFKGLRVLTNNYWSDGGGRYIFGQAPDLIAKADGSLSLIHASSTVSGFEFTHKNSLLYGYYGGIYIGRNTAIDTDGKLVGYGYSGSSAGQNRAIQEGTFGVIQTFWKDAKYGALSLITQYSYLTRNPWSVATGKPANADLHMVFVDLRYTLPGSAPTLGKF